jgi:thiamine pyrophosphate-dependent acetolactate synthase large subunit-like protein
MSKTVGDFLVQRLYQWGVRHIFGYPGDGINGVFGALANARPLTRLAAMAGVVFLTALFGLTLADVPSRLAGG